MRTELLEVGARVMVRESHGWHGSRHSPGTVSRKTPKGMVTVTVDDYPYRGTIAHEVIFNSDGNERGQRYSGRSLEPFDQKLLNQEIYDARISKMRKDLEDYRLWRNQLSDAAIEKIAAIVKESK